MSAPGKDPSMEKRWIDCGGIMHKGLSNWGERNNSLNFLESKIGTQNKALNSDGLYYAVF
jgi:hypothetical protein